MLAQNLWKLNSFIVVVDVVFILTICSYWYQIRHEIEEARTRNATSTLNLLMKNYDKRLRPKFGGKSRVNAHFKILKKNSGGHLLPKTLYSAMVFCHVRSLNFFCFISFIFFSGRPVTVYIDVYIVDIGEISVTNMVRPYVFLVSWTFWTNIFFVKKDEKL